MGNRVAEAGEENVTVGVLVRDPRLAEFLSPDAVRRLEGELELSSAQLDVARSALKVRRIRLGSELETPQPKPEPDRMLKVAEAAMRIGIARDTLYRNSRDYPFTRRPRPHCLRFSERGIEEWVAGGRRKHGLAPRSSVDADAARLDNELIWRDRRYA